MTLSTTGIPTVRPPKRSLFDLVRLPKIALALAACGFFVIFFFWPLLDVVLRSFSVDGIMDWATHSSRSKATSRSIKMSTCISLSGAPLFSP